MKATIELDEKELNEFLQYREDKEIICLSENELRCNLHNLAILILSAYGGFPSQGFNLDNINLEKFEKAYREANEYVI